MKRVVLAAVMAACLSGVAQAQTPTLAERATLSLSPAFQQRVGIAAMQQAIAVATEVDTTPNHAVRLKLAVWMLTEPDVLARKLAVLIASIESVSATTTDAEIKTLFQTNWTTIAVMYTSVRG